MYVEHLGFEKPENEEAKIWRYMDFTKFVSVLDKSALFFSRADKLGDQFEGSYPKANIDFRKTGQSVIREENSGEFSKLVESLRKFTVVNCWHLNEHESAAMWRLYLKSDEGIAIQSTFGLLKTCFKDETHEIYIGKVKYIDYGKDVIPEAEILRPFLHKRKSFEHEHELRAAILVEPNGDPRCVEPPFDDGIYVPVDLDILVETIYLAPTSPKWLFDLVESVNKKYGLNKDVLQSSLDDKPVY